MITILITDVNLTVVGDPITAWTEIDATVRFREPATGSFTAPARPEIMAQLSAGNRVAVIRDGAEFCSGPYETSAYTWSVGADPGEVVVTFSDDLALIAGRVTYPDPTLPATDAGQPAQYTATSTSAETVLRNLVNLNAGPGALTARRVPSLALGSVASVGSSITYSTRWEPLGDALRSVAIAGGDLGFRTARNGAAIEFQVYSPADLTSLVRYSRGLGNLRSVQYERSAPTVTAAIVGGAGEGDARVIHERTQTGWWRSESFIDQSGTEDTAELDQAGDEALTEGAESVRLATVTIDTPTQRYGIHYGLGDRVSVEVPPGVEVADVVRSVHLQATPDAGEIVTAFVGSANASVDPEWVRRLRSLDRRLSYIEGR